MNNDLIKTFKDASPNLVFLLQASLMIPTVLVKPSLDDVQEALITAGKSMSSVSKGVAQWDNGTKDGKSEKVIITKLICFFQLIVKKILYIII